MTNEDYAPLPILEIEAKPSSQHEQVIASLPEISIKKEESEMFDE